MGISLDFIGPGRYRVCGGGTERLYSAGSLVVFKTWRYQLWVEYLTWSQFFRLEDSFPSSQSALVAFKENVLWNKWHAPSDPTALTWDLRLKPWPYHFISLPQGLMTRFELGCSTGPCWLESFMDALSQITAPCLSASQGFGHTSSCKLDASFLKF